MADNAATSSVLRYVDHGAYPESEEAASATLGPEMLVNLLAELHQTREEVKGEIRKLSKDTAPNIDAWISRAKELQAEIHRSRDAARQIVAEAEAGKELRARVEDAGNKAALLEKEVGFNQALVSTLEQVRHVSGLLDRVQDEAVKGSIQTALKRLEEVEGSLGVLQDVAQTRAYALLEGRAKSTREDLVQTTTEYWNAAVEVSQEEKRLHVRRDLAKAAVPGAKVPTISLDLVVATAKGLGIFDGLVQRLGRDIDRAILRPRLLMNRDGRVAKVTTSHEVLSCSGEDGDTSYGALFKDLHDVLDFLALHLPSSISTPLSDTWIPALASRLEDNWFEPAVPLDISEMPTFQGMLNDIEVLADHVDRLDWHASKPLRDWVQSAPRNWLTKRRETVLGDVRNLVFSGLRETKVVERVETQMMSKADGVFAAGTSDDDEWETAWDEPEDQPKLPVATSSTRSQGAPAADDDETSAWENDDAVGDPTETGGGGEDAWGWGDEEASQQPKSALAQQPNTRPKVNGDEPAANSAAVEREMTLREKFKVTSVPDELLSTIKSVIADAEELAGPAFASSPIAPAGTGLYTLPTLALAIYRATAPTAYSKLATGNMLIYNDSLHLASQIREWQASQPPGSRLRHENDVKALEAFAKRAYSSEMDSQRTILGDLLDGAQGFGNCTIVPFKGECESAVDQTVDRLRDVHRLWQDVLSRSALLQSLGTLLASVTGKMMSEIEDLGDISEADSHQLKLLMDRITGITALFQQQRPEGGEAVDMTFIYCPNWLKFHYLGEILDSSLADIKYLWNEGELSLEFDAEEVVELIGALFAESDLRRRAIVEIRRGGMR